MGLGEHRPELAGVDGAVADAEHVAALGQGDQRRTLRIEGPAQAADVPLNEVDAVLRRVVVPQRRDDPSHRDRLAGVQQQEGEHRLLGERPEVDRLVVPVGPERPEDLEPQRDGGHVGISISQHSSRPQHSDAVRPTAEPVTRSGESAGEARRVPG